MKNKKILISCGLIALLVSCSSGGGGGGEPSLNSSISKNDNINPTLPNTNKPIENKSEASTTPNKDHENNNNTHNEDSSISDKKDENDNDKQSSSSSNKDHENNNTHSEDSFSNLKITNIEYSTNSINIPNIPEFSEKEGFKIAVIDTDFIAFKEDLNKLYPGIEVVEKDPNTPPLNGNHHGTNTLHILADNTKLLPIVGSIGSPGSSPVAVHPSLYVYKEILKAFGEQKIKIFNQSWGTNIEDKMYENYNKYTLDTYFPKNTASSFISFYKDVVDNKGGLFVWSSGNTGKPGSKTILYNNSGVFASMPKIYPELEKGWISVVGLVPYEYLKEANGHYAYAGVAKNWSISSVGYGSWKNNDGSATSETGSSAAAPRISKVAAFISEKYPWMTNSQIRETLFTTTDDVEKNVDYDTPDKQGMKEENRYLKTESNTRFGWGVLNEKRALKGPGQFLKILLEVDKNNLDNIDNKYYFQARVPQGTTSYFENNIYGDSGINKSGKGSLHLTGKNFFAGDSKISEGELHIYRLYSSDNTTILENGTLILHDQSIIGKLDKNNMVIANSANLLNKGTLKIEGANALIAGNYTSENSGITKINAGSTLTVLGKVTLSPNDKIEVETNTYLGKPIETKIISNDGIIGNSNPNIVPKGMLKAKINKNNNEINIEVSRENAVNYLDTDNEVIAHSANNIESELVNIDKKIQSGIATAEDVKRGISLQSLSRREFTKISEISSGEIYASAQALTLAQAQNINRNISDHLSTLRDFNKSSDEWQGWMQGIGSNGTLTQSGYAKGKIKSTGVQFGIDKNINNSLQFGTAITYSEGEAKFNRYAGKAKSKSTDFSIYSKKYLNNNYYLLGKIGFSAISSTVQREVVNKDAKIINSNIKHNDKMYSGYLEIGKDFQYFTPYLGISQEILKRGSFNEKDASWGIKANKKSYYRNTLVLGVRAEYSYSTYTFNSYIRHEVNIGNRDLSFDGKFTDSNITHKFTGIKQEKNTTWIGVGVSKKISENTSISANLNFKLEKNKKTDTVGGIGFKFTF